MRYAWITLVVIIADQAAKWFLPELDINRVWQLGFADISLELPKTPPLSTQGESQVTSTNTYLILLAGVLGIYLFITRISGQLHFIADKAAIGLHLAGGGLASQIVDYAYRDEVLHSFRLNLGDKFSFNAGIADLALIAGFLLLLTTLLRGGTKVQSRLPLAAADVPSLDLNILPRGIDNIHIDVQLSPRFRKNIIRLIHMLVPLVVQQLHQGKRHLSLPQKQFSVIRKEFNDLVNVALRRAKETGEKQIPDLLFIATMKLIHSEVNNTVAAIMQQSKEGSKEHHIRGLKVIADDKYIAWLFRYRDHIIALSNSTLVAAVCSEQKDALTEGVKNFLGQETTFSIEAIESPLVISESPESELVLLENYLLLGQQQNDENSFVNIDKQLTEVFSDYLNLLEINKGNIQQEFNKLQRGSDLNSNTIFTLTQPSVLMNAENIAVLLDTDWTRDKINNTKKFSEFKTYRKLRQHRRFQRLLRRKLAERLKKSGLSTWIIASYEVAAILKKMDSDVSAGQLTALLARKPGKQEFNQKLADLFKLLNNPPPTSSVASARERIQKEHDTLLDKYLLQFIRDFARYRRDLLTLLIYQRAASDLILLEEKRDIDTSRANFSLYSFLHRSEAQDANAPILSHVIIKADLRGSTEVTEKLTELKLNPATHFDRNFFSPINNVIESYGAEKVFIEGDAIILILNDRAGMGKDRLISARACGLAAKILDIVARQNRELAAYGLPELELGIGISFHHGPPRYLFDGHHRITISPAINRADRLSSCNWSIRNWYSAQQHSNNFVEVYQPSEQAIKHGEKAQKEMIFNLNGILLEAAVFKRIAHELTPQQVANTLSEIKQSELYAFQVTDMNGNKQTLMLRKAPLHIYDPAYRVSDCPVAENRYFYEVIHDRTTLKKLLKRY